jgi:hypothetical protein
MARHRTDAAKVGMAKPAHLRHKTVDELRAYFNDHCPIAHPKNKSAKYLKACADAVLDPRNWKNPFYAVHTECGPEWVKLVAIWYHGAVPYITFSGVGSHGYACY